MIDPKPLVSICIPAFNAAPFIEETLRSLMAQTYKNIELIISDNASTDDSMRIIGKLMQEDARISYHKNEQNLGYARNLNKLINLAQSEYVAIYHADDVYHPDIVEQEACFLNQNKELAGCFTLAKTIDSQGMPREESFVYTEKNLKSNLIVDQNHFVGMLLKAGNIFVCPTSMIRKRVYEEMGGYDVALQYVEDQDMWIRILEKHKLGILAKELVCYRMHNQQASSYYRTCDRNSLSPSLEHIYRYFSERNRSCDLLNEAIANDYLNLAKNAVHQNDYQRYRHCIIKSRKFPLPLKGIRKKMLQMTPIRVSFLVKRAELLSKKRSVK